MTYKRRTEKSPLFSHPYGEKSAIFELGPGELTLGGRSLGLVEGATIMGPMERPALTAESFKAFIEGEIANAEQALIDRYHINWDDVLVQACFKAFELDPRLMREYAKERPDKRKIGRYIRQMRRKENQ